LLNQPSTLAKLRAELQAVAKDLSILPSIATLEALPYLNATIAETLRHSYGPVSRLPRIHVNDAVKLQSTFKIKSGEIKHVEYVVPPGYPISMTSVHVHMNPALFPDPTAFKPERWLGLDGKRHHDLDKYILSFSKGTRQCVGIK
jgi:cytochrome P450